MKSYTAFIAFVVTLVWGVSAMAIPVTLEECQKKLTDCDSQKATCEEAFSDLAKDCLGRDVKPGDYLKDKPKGKDKPQGDKPKRTEPVVICLPPATVDKGDCVCPADTTLGGPQGDGPQPAKRHPGKAPNVFHGFCAPTYNDVVAAYNRLLATHKLTCDTSKLDAAKATSSDASEEQKEGVKLEVGRIQKECADFNARVVKVLRWKTEFEEKADDKVPDLTADSWREIWLRTAAIEGRVDQAFEEIDALKKKVAEHDAALGELCVPKEGQPLPEACKKARQDFLAKGNMTEGPWETQIIAAGFYNGRFGADSTDSYGANLNVNFIHWVDEHNGVLVGGIVGHGWSSDSNRMVAGGRLAYIHAFDKDRVWRFRIGLLMTVEPNIVGNDATNIAPEIGFQFRPKGSPFVCDLGLAVGGSKIVQYVGGERAANSDIGWLVSPSFGCGLSLQWGNGGKVEATEQ